MLSTLQKDGAKATVRLVYKVMCASVWERGGGESCFPSAEIILSYIVAFASVENLYPLYVTCVKVRFF